MIWMLDNQTCLQLNGKHAGSQLQVLSGADHFSVIKWLKNTYMLPISLTSDSKSFKGLHEPFPTGITPACTTTDWNQPSKAHQEE